jgi:hypothetical protein
MLNTIGKFLNSALPVSIAVGGLSKIDPRFKKFFYSAGLAGYGTDAALDYLRNQFEGEGSKQETNRLQEREQSGNARPDELQALRTTQQNESIPNAIQKGVSVGAGLAGGLAGMGANAIAGTAAGVLGGGSTQEQGQGTPEDQSADAGNMIQGQPQGKPQSPLSEQAMEQDIQAQNEQLGEFQDILNAIQSRMSRGGRSLEQAAQEVAMNDNFKPKVQRIEQSGIKFMDWVRRQLGGQQGPQGQGQQPQRNDRIQMMQQITQALGSLKR